MKDDPLLQKGERKEEGEMKLIYLKLTRYLKADF